MNNLTTKQNRMKRLTVRRIQRTCDKHGKRFSKQCKKSAIRIAKKAMSKSLHPSEISREHSMIIALCSLWISNKFHDLYYVPLDDVIMMSRTMIPRKEMLKNEIILLKDIDYDLLKYD